MTKEKELIASLKGFPKELQEVYIVAAAAVEKLAKSRPAAQAEDEVLKVVQSFHAELSHAEYKTVSRELKRIFKIQ